MITEPINLAQKFERFAEAWQPKVVAELNDYQFKLVRLLGEFVWHDHADTDEAFLVLEGEIDIDFGDTSIHVSAGELVVVPKGVRHRPRAAAEAKVLVIEPRGVRNTGARAHARTAPDDVWI